MITRPLILLAPDAPATVGAPPPASLNSNPGGAALAAAAPVTAAPSAPSPAPSSEPNPFDAQDSEIEKALAASAPKPSAAPAKPAAKPPEKPAAPAAKPKVEGIDVLRTERDRLKTEHATAQSEVSRLKAELDAAKRNGEATSALTQELAAAKKERDQYQQELRMARYEPSEPVKAERKNFNLLAGRSKRIIESLQIPDADGNVKPASWDKFQQIFVKLEPGPAIAAIKEMFGDNASVAERQYWDLFSADERVQSAETEDRATFQQRVTSETATRQQQKEGYLKMVSAVENDLRTKQAEIFAENPEDPEGNAILQKGMRLADQATDPAKYNALSPQQQAVVAANVRLMVGSHGRMKLNIGRLKAENASLKAKIAELEGGAQPPTNRPGGVEAPPKEDNWETDFDKSVSMA